MTSSEITAQAQTNQIAQTQNGLATGKQYDGQGNLLTFWGLLNQANSERDLTYDGLGRVIQMIEPASGVTETYAYNAEGLRTVVNAYLSGTLQSQKFNIYNDARQLVSAFEAAASTTTLTQAQVKTQTLATKTGTSQPMVTIPPGKIPVDYPGSLTITYTGSPAVTTGSVVALSATYGCGCPYTGPTYSWAFGDGGTATGNSVTHTYATQGVYTITVVAQPTFVNDMEIPEPASASLGLTAVGAPGISAFAASASTLNAGQPLTLSWSVTNGTALSISNVGAVTGSSTTWNTSVPGSSPVTTSYVLTVTNTYNGCSFSATSSPVPVTVYPDPTVPTLSLTAAASRVGAGKGGTTLSWNVGNGGIGAVAVTLNGASVSPSISGYAVNPVSTTTYKLIATTTEGSQSQTASTSVTVVVEPLPLISAFTASTTAVLFGGSSTLSWSIQNADAVTLNGAALSGSALIQGSQTVIPSATTTYTLLATSLAGTVSQAVTVVVDAPVITSFTASTNSLALGSTTTLSWVVQSAATLTVNGNPVPANMRATGSQVVACDASAVYTLTASNASGSVSQATTVTVVGTGGLVWVRDVLYLGGKEVAEADVLGIHATIVDHLDSPRFILDTSGNIVGQQKFMPFGETLDQRGSLITAKGFTNHEQTDPSGLIYMQARFYLPQYHRFSSPDPARDQHFEETQSWNIYSYCQNQPVMKIDPTGMDNFWNTFGHHPDSSSDTTNESLKSSIDAVVNESKECQLGLFSDKSHQLVEAQDAARNSPSNQPETNSDGRVVTTHCNSATAEVASDTGAPTAPLVGKGGTPENPGLNANQQAKNLAQSPDYKVVSSKDAQGIANNGNVVIGAQINPGGHGHVATVRPAGVDGDNPTGKSGPLINNIGGHNGIRRESNSFESTLPLKYYTPVIQ